MKWNQNFLTDLENSVRKVFTLEFVIPKQNGESRTCAPVFRQSNINVNANSMSRASSQPKISQTFIKSNSLVGLSKFAESTSYSTFFPEPERNMTTSMQKQSFIRKNNSFVSDAAQNDAKENYLVRSSYISVDPYPEVFNKQSIINNLSSFTRPSY